ncbi:hypothetical protein E4U54_001183 [Claviceps lovelessii]|nr:hypothetical protein E4U54_001183 [Claviceps lovelessii]
MPYFPSVITREEALDRPPVKSAVNTAAPKTKTTPITSMQSSYTSQVEAMCWWTCEANIPSSACLSPSFGARSGTVSAPGVDDTGAP